ncbi:MAG TPA: ABC transporter substrate-binding protein [Candidatus Baltobacteraceae bacterium]|nr:ABC transporter substrate-binding protein [Candidatus Baltobacteraceae bacterium]
MPRSFVRLLAPVLLVALTVLALPAHASPVLRVGSDISYAPLEFYGAPSHTMQGFDIDLARALGEKLGAPVAIANHQFDSILNDVSKGTVDLGISAISDTRAREKQVDFVDYLLVGSGMLVPAGNPKHVFELGALCGMKVDVQKGTSQETAIVAQSQKCQDVHLAAIKVHDYTTDDEAFAAFQAGKTDVHVTDYPVVAYLAKTMGGGTKYQAAGRQFALVPYGIAVEKDNAPLRSRVVAAIHALIADGTYARLLKKWGLEQGALRSAPINAGTLFDK